MNPLPPRANTPIVPSAAADEEDADAPASDTVRPPSARDGGWRDAREEPAEDEVQEDLPDVAALSRAANTAASLGRAPIAQPTAKMKPFDLADALAKLSKPDEDEKKKR